jgi:trafficking protein particle complex subunit 11
MDGYAPAYVAHNIPYLVVSGLGVHTKEAIRKDGGIRIQSGIPPVESEDAATLLKYFQDSDASNLAWNGREHSGRNKFRVKTVGRVVLLGDSFTSSH